MEELREKGSEDLCAWLGEQLDEDEKEDVFRVIKEQKIKGENFLTYTWQKWKAGGLTGGIAETLVQIAERVKKSEECFQASDEQLKECFQILEQRSGLREYLESFDEEKFFEERHFLHAHRTARNLPSKAGDALRELFRALYNTVVLIGVSGCGKSHAIYLNALDRTCLYLTPDSWLLWDFYKQCLSIRRRYESTSEMKYRSEIQDLFFKYICARYVVLMYLKKELSASNEYLFFFQSAGVLHKSDRLIHMFCSKKYRKIKQTLLSGCFLAVDEAQKYCTPGFNILFRTGVSKVEPISFARFFSWCSPVLCAEVVISGTSLRLRDMDRLGTGNRPLPEYGIKVHHDFDYFDCSRVKDIVNGLVESYVEPDVLDRVGFLLQGRPRILLNFIENIKRNGCTLESYLEDYVRSIVENADSEVWSFYGLWKDLFESTEKKSFKVSLRLRSEKAGIECDVQTCFLKILMDSIRLLDDEEDDGKMASGSWFSLTSHDFDNVSSGLCPFVNLEKSNYRFMEPLSMLAGLYYVVSSPELRSKCVQLLLEAMLAKGTTEQVRGSYFDLFVAMKVAADGVFRKRLFDMAVEVGRLNDRTTWISEMTLPEKDYFQLKCRISDEAFVRSLEDDEDDVIMPSNLAGPDVKWWIFVFGLKTTWTGSVVSVDESSKNEESVTPSLCFDWRDVKKKGKPLTKKRKLLNEKCTEIAATRVKESRGFVRVRIELPTSNFICINDHNLTHDIHLNIDWQRLRNLLSEEEAHYLESYLQ